MYLIVRCLQVCVGKREANSEVLCLLSYKSVMLVQSIYHKSGNIS